MASNAHVWYAGRSGVRTDRFGMPPEINGNPARPLDGHR